MAEAIGTTGIVAAVIIISLMIALIIFRLKFGASNRGQQAERICHRNYADARPQGQGERGAGQGVSWEAQANMAGGRNSVQHGMKNMQGKCPSQQAEVDPWLLSSVATLQPIEPAKCNSKLHAREGDIFFAPRYGEIRGGQSWV